MGRSQSWAISEVVALVALLFSIALSPGSVVRYGRHHGKTVITLCLPSLVILVMGLLLFSLLSTVTSGGHNVADSLLATVLVVPSAEPLIPYNRPALFVMAACVADWVGCRLFMLPSLTTWS